MKKMVMGIVVLIGIGLAGTAQSYQVPDEIQSIHGWADNSWSFMTAWNLAGGGLEMSNSWYSGEYRFEHSVNNYQEWIARFIYNQVQGRTQALAWYYDQLHVQ